MYTAVSGRWDIYSGEWKLGYIEVSGSWDIYSGGRRVLTVG
jgi:hypothetical protein